MQSQGLSELSLSSPISGVTDPMDRIKAIVEEYTTTTDLQETVFDMNWNLKRYMNEELVKVQSLASMLTVTGTSNNAWATSCEEYTRRTWPKTGMTVLAALQKKHQADYGDVIPWSLMPLNPTASDGDFVVEIKHSIGSYARFRVQGSRKEIVQVGQQLAWLASVFRTGTADRPSYFDFKFKALSLHHFSLIALGLRQVPDSQASCWLPLLAGGVIATGFPIPDRDEELGVEIPFDTMLQLACVEYPVYYGEVIVFRGWQTLLYPVKASTDFSTIQWHLTLCDDPEDSMLTENLSAIAQVPNWRTCNIDEIRKARSFLGYNHSAETCIGTQRFRVQSAEDKCGAKNEESRMFWQKKINVNMGTSGMGAFGLGVGGEIGFTKTQIANMAARDGFDRTLDLSQRTPVLMYDVSKCTAWLVPELNVVLHITRSWFLERTDLVDGEIYKLPYATISEDGGRAAMETISSNHMLQFQRKSDAVPWKFMDIVKDSLRILKACRDTRDRTQSSTSVSWLLSWFQNPISTDGTWRT